MTDLSLLSLNIGQPKSLGFWHGEEVLSAIDKRPVTTEDVFVHATTIAGDGQVDLRYHGGVDGAVYAYPADHWPWWEREKRLVCRPGLFGENLTVGGADETAVHIGDRFQWGEVLLEVSQPRAPCFKFSLHTGRPDAPAAMTLSGRCGWYFRVLSEGRAPSRGEVRRIFECSAPTVRETFTAVFSRNPDAELLRRIHACPALASAWRRQVGKRMIPVKP